MLREVWFRVLAFVLGNGGKDRRCGEAMVLGGAKIDNRRAADQSSIFNLQSLLFNHAFAWAAGW